MAGFIVFEGSEVTLSIAICMEISFKYLSSNRTAAAYEWITRSFIHFKNTSISLKYFSSNRTAAAYVWTVKSFIYFKDTHAPLQG